MNQSNSTRKRKTPPPDDHQESDKEEQPLEFTTPNVKAPKKQHKRKKEITNEESTDQQDSPSGPVKNLTSAIVNRKESTTPLRSEAGPSKRDKPPKPDKGKKKQAPEVEEVVSDSGSEMDVELITGFEILEMDRQTTIGEKRPNDLVTSFEIRPQVYFSDHMAPFRGLMSHMREESQEAKAKAITQLLMENRSKKFLATTSGKGIAK